MTFKLKTNHITIETTNACPGNCVICPRDRYYMKPETMTMKVWKKIIDDLVTHGYEEKLIIDTQGFGDPFADPHLFERIRYAKEKIPCVKTFSSSTCHLMTPDKHDDVIKYINTLRLSFYGMTKKTFESVHRGTVEFEQCLFNILNLQEKMNEVQGGPYIIGFFILQESINDHEFEDWKYFWEPRVDEVIVWKPHNFGGLKEYYEVDHDNQVSCGRPENGPLYVHCDGVVSMCCWDINEELYIGDLKTQTIEEVLHTDEYKRICDKHRKKDFKGLYCHHCEQTNPKPENLIYHTNPNRGIGKMTSDFLKMTEETGEKK